MFWGFVLLTGDTIGAECCGKLLMLEFMVVTENGTFSVATFSGLCFGECPCGVEWCRDS